MIDSVMVDSLWTAIEEIQKSPFVSTGSWVSFVLILVWISLLTMWLNRVDNKQREHEEK